MIYLIQVICNMVRPEFSLSFSFGPVENGPGVRGALPPNFMIQGKTAAIQAGLNCNSEPTNSHAMPSFFGIFPFVFYPMGRVEKRDRL